MAEEIKRQDRKRSELLFSKGRDVRHAGSLAELRRGLLPWFLAALGACAPPPEARPPALAQGGSPCTLDGDCPSSPCRTGACVQGRCRVELARPGTFPEQGQTPGDCQRFLCGVGGELLPREDPSDLPPDDGNPCTREVCSAGVPGRLPLPPGGRCGAGVCTSAGACVGLAEIAVGRYHGCLRVGDGSVQCWGAAERGQTGAIEEGGSASLPVQVQGLSGVRALALGGNHSCALAAAQVLCWGANEHGQLGDGFTADHPAPMPVQGLSGVRAIAAGLDTTCASTETDVFCWGLGSSGQLGHGKRSSSPLPVRVALSAAPTQLSVGGAHACAVLTGGQVLCWGANDHGQLGDGTTAERKTPVKVVELGAARQVVAGRNHSCALLMDGTVRCWGWNNDHQLGIDAVEKEASPRPLPVAGLAEIVEIAAGNSHSCARLRSGKIRCWGWNRDGQIGPDSVGDASTPVEHPSILDAVQLALGSKHSCARLAAGNFSCWGDNSRSQLGVAP